MKKAFLWFGSILVVLACAGLVSASSVADAAKREKERRAKIKASDKVFTNQDIADFKAKNNIQDSTEEEVAENGEAVEKKDAEAEEDQELDKSTDEEYWRGRFQDAKAKVDDLQAQHDSLQSDLNAMVRNTVGNAGYDTMAAINQAKDELAQLKQSLEEAKAELEGLEDEARKAGAPPGWVRE